MIVRSFIATAAALTLAGTATAAEPKPPIPAAAPTTNAGEAAATDSKRYCIVETLTGSRVPSKVCKTKRQWRAQGVELPSAN